MFAAHAGELEHGRELTEALRFHSVRFTQSVEQSKAIARIRGFHVIISASGMCEAGRIRHHLRQWLSRAEATVLMVGFQAQGTLGRTCRTARRACASWAKKSNVRASIRRLDIYSGHADGPALARWIAARAPVAGNVFLVHGEEKAMEGLNARIAAGLPRGFGHHARARRGMVAAGRRCAAHRGARRPVCRRRSSGAFDWHNDLSKLISTSTNPCAAPRRAQSRPPHPHTPPGARKRRALSRRAFPPHANSQP